MALLAIPRNAKVLSLELTRLLGMWTDMVLMLDQLRLILCNQSQPSRHGVLPPIT